MRARGILHSASASPDEGEAALGRLAFERFGGYASPACYHRSTSVNYVEPVTFPVRGKGMGAVARRFRALR